MCELIGSGADVDGNDAVVRDIVQGFGSDEFFFPAALLDSFCPFIQSRQMCIIGGKANTAVYFFYNSQTF